MALNMFLFSPEYRNNGLPEARQILEFETRFVRCRNLLHFVACRVLETTEGAEHAVERCRLRASQNPPMFEFEGAFRSWLVRILIDEALTIRLSKPDPPLEPIS